MVTYSSDVMADWLANWMIVWCNECSQVSGNVLVIV